MKQFKHVLTIPMCGMLLLCGCGSSASNAVQTADIPVDEEQESETILVKESACFAEYVKSLDELCDLADIIIEFHSGETAPFIDGDRVYTSVIAQDVTTYKGDYQGEPIYSIGGTVNLQTYYENVSAMEKSYISRYTAEERKQTTIRRVTEGCLLVESNQRYLLFAAKEENEFLGTIYRPIYTMEGYYPCDDSYLWLGDDVISPLCDELRANFAVPELNTETSTALSKADILAVVESKM